jgi:hypothetical protein
VTWPAFVQAARVRAIEDTDAEDKVWDAELRRELTREGGQGAASSGTFLARRADLLASRGQFASVRPKLAVSTVPSWIAIPGWIVIFVAGWGVAALGQESEINLLALPLIFILLWNAVVVLWSLWPGLHKAEPREGDWRETVLAGLEGRKAATTAASPADAPLIARFRELVREPMLERMACRFRAWLHVGAALLALGSIVGMYAHGWSKEYHAVWESTLLDEAGASKFFRALFSPASVVTGQTIPLDEVPGMRRHADAPASRPGDALPWIHLYAATLGLFVLVPRMLLTLLELSRARAVPGKALQSAGWQAYVQRLRSLVEGAGAPALVLTHGLAQDTAAQDRWRHWTYLHWRDVGQLAFESVPVGGEAEFVNAWVPATPRVMVVFNMAATPEPEVQRALVESLADKLQAARDGATSLLLALDDADLRERWAGFGDLAARLAERSAAWSETMDGCGAVWHEMMMPKRTAATSLN